MKTGASDCRSNGSRPESACRGRFPWRPDRSAEGKSLAYHRRRRRARPGRYAENLTPNLREHRLPEAYDAVLLDVPCSNTGVMRHRVDVKWRLQPGDFKKHPQQQLSMLHAAARFVAPGGRLVYSTCSIDAEENEHVVRAFLASKAGGPFKLERSCCTTRGLRATMERAHSCCGGRRIIEYCSCPRIADRRESTTSMTSTTHSSPGSKFALFA